MRKVIIMELVKIVKQRIVIGANLYSRYFVDASGAVVGIPTGLSFKLRPSISGLYTAIYYIERDKDTPQRIGTDYANSFESQCSVMKNRISSFLASQKTPYSYTNASDGKRRLGKNNYEDVITPPGVRFVKKPIGSIGFSVSVIDQKTLKKKTEFWYCGRDDTWRSRYFKTLKMVLKYKRANDKLLERITLLIDADHAD